VLLENSADMTLFNLRALKTKHSDQYNINYA
jgi:hypothetical protein